MQNLKCHEIKEPENLGHYEKAKPKNKGIASEEDSNLKGPDVASSTKS